MSKNWQIKIGDLVHVDFNNAQITLVKKGIVLCVPLSSGDSWVFEDTSNGKIHYVSEGCTITKLNEKIE